MIINLKNILRDCPKIYQEMLKTFSPNLFYAIFFTKYVFIEEIGANNFFLFWERKDEKGFFLGKIGGMFFFKDKLKKKVFSGKELVEKSCCLT